MFHLNMSFRIYALFSNSFSRDACWDNFRWNYCLFLYFAQDSIIFYIFQHNFMVLAIFLWNCLFSILSRIISLPIFFKRNGAFSPFSSGNTSLKIYFIWVWFSTFFNKKLHIFEELIFYESFRRNLSFFEIFKQNFKSTWKGLTLYYTKKRSMTRETGGHVNPFCYTDKPFHYDFFCVFAVLDHNWMILPPLCEFGLIVKLYSSGDI